MVCIFSQSRHGYEICLSVEDILSVCVLHCDVPQTVDRVQEVLLQTNMYFDVRYYGQMFRVLQGIKAAANQKLLYIGHPMYREHVESITCSSLIMCY